VFIEIARPAELTIRVPLGTTFVAKADMLLIFVLRIYLELTRKALKVADAELTHDLVVIRDDVPAQRLRVLPNLVAERAPGHP
jgi:hypothetical protein